MTAILLSRPLLDAHGERIRALCVPLGPLRLVALAPGGALDPADIADVEIAFLSTDVMGASSNPDHNPALAAFLAAVAGAPRLRWLHLCSAGADRPVFRELMARGVEVTTSSGANAVEVAHTALAAALAFAREVPVWIEAKAARAWSPRRDELAPRDFRGSRATVVGMGPIGREIARLCGAFGLHVTGVRRTAQPLPECSRVVPTAMLAAVLQETDWLFLACPLTPQTRGLIDAAMLARLPAHARLLNVSRGAVVAEPALVDALVSGRLAGAYADVFATEPLPAQSPLWDAPNFMLSAHSAGSSQGFPARTVEMFMDNLARRASGQALLNPAIQP
jgi:phosphoglycerate dehydrogenase-like enzyme